MITGLDPAAPLFYKLPETHRLSMNDATCVETLHTTQGAGFPCELGRVSYFVNGGTVQPGCVPSYNLISVETCSHSIAHNYYAEAIRLGNDNLFYSEKCENRNCCQEKADVVQKPGTNSTCKNSGIFAFNTHPYGLNATEDYGLGTDGAVSCSGKECYQNSIFYPCKGDK
uniref:Lipase domain-containing protein n=1 Tax=Megaselia scalaris TaxID=36166 RepID=T1GQE4_MEGSC